MIQSAFHRPGVHSRLEGCPSLRFASARRLGFPVLRASTTTTPFVRLLPRRYDREHDPSKGRFLAAPADPAGAGPDHDEKLPVAPVSFFRRSLRTADELERASRAG